MQASSLKGPMLGIFYSAAALSRGKKVTSSTHKSGCGIVKCQLWLFGWHPCLLYPSYPIMINKRVFEAFHPLVGKQENLPMLSRCLVLRCVIGGVLLAAAAMTPKMVFGQAAGVAIDADGVVRLKSAADQSGQLTKQQQAAIRAGLNTEAAKSQPDAIYLAKTPRKGNSRQEWLNHRRDAIPGRTVAGPLPVLLSR